MEVENESVDKIPHEVTLEVSDFRDASSSKSIHFKSSNIECNVTGKVGFLDDFVKSPEDYMKIITLVSLHALGKDIKGPHLFPGEEVLFVREINIDGEAITYEKTSDLAGYMITLHECQKINSFVYQGNFQLTSVLWLLSEFAVTKFCKGRE